MTLTTRISPLETLEVIEDDPPDHRILECAVSAGSSYILIWDKDLLRLKSYAGIIILTPEEFVRNQTGR